MAQWGTSELSTVSGEDNRRFPREQEGFARAVNVPAGEVPRCGSVFNSFSIDLADFRGPLPGGTGPFLSRTSLTWESSPAVAAETTVFTWIGGSQVRPAMRPAFPHVTATLAVNNVSRMEIPLGLSEGYTITGDSFTLWFEPRRLLSLTEEPDRTFSPHGVSGIYRLQVPAEALTPGSPVQITVELKSEQPDCETFFYVSPRTNALEIDKAILRDEVARLQADLVQLTRSHEMLYAQVYPDLFPNRVQGERRIAHASEQRHMHPPCLTVMRDGEVVITFRDATAHLDVNGRMMIMRSQDHGRTWSAPQILFALPRADHRCAPITELANGEWVTFDYRAGGEYHSDGSYCETEILNAPTLWGAWSTNRGESWTFTDTPLQSPHAVNRYAEGERHILQLPSGRLLLAANTVPTDADKALPTEIAIFASDDNGRHWDYLSRLPLYPAIYGEPTLLDGDNGRIVLLSRSAVQESTFAHWHETGMLVQYISLDGGVTWGEGMPTKMSSMSTPAHLLRLQDGRFLCTHASRGYPASIYVTTSDDQGTTWKTDRTKIITNDIISYDSTYPTTGQLADGRLITAWYGSLFGKFFIATLTYLPEELG